jgi:hypothetical protein
MGIGPWNQPPRALSLRRASWPRGLTEETSLRGDDDEAGGADVRTRRHIPLPIRPGKTPTFHERRSGRRISARTPRVEAVPLVVEMLVRLLIDILAPFRVGIQALRTRIRSLPRTGIVQRPLTTAASALDG